MRFELEPVLREHLFSSQQDPQVMHLQDQCHPAKRDGIQQGLTLTYSGIHLNSMGLSLPTPNKALTSLGHCPEISGWSTNITQQFQCV